MQGPAGAFLSRLHELSWSWLGDGFVQDHFGLQWHFFHLPIQALQHRAREAWCRQVGEQLETRQGFKGLCNVDAAFTTAKLSKLSPDELGMMRTALNGSFFTNDKLVKTGKASSNTCNWCNGEDSLYHRYWECPFFHESRLLVPSSVLLAVPNWPPCLAERGWFQQVDGLAQLQAGLCQLPDATSEFFITELDSEGPIHIFSDGSCLESQCPALRLGSWGIVAAILANHDFVPIASGLTPGLWQTTLRAEITAVIAAVRFALLQHRPIWIWTDNEFVYNRIQSYLLGALPPFNTDSDHDLWGRLHSLICKANQWALVERCVKVRSHQDEAAYPEAVELWAIQGNEFADRVAAEARQALPGELVTLWHQVQDNILYSCNLREVVHGHFLRVAGKAIQHNVRQSDERISREAVSPEEDFDPQQASLVLPHDFLVDANFPFAEWDSLVEFWLTDMAVGEDSVWMWVSAYQLFLDFQFTCQHPGFVYLYNRKCWIQADEWLITNDYDILRLSAWFVSFLRFFSQRYGLYCQQQLRRPYGTVIKCWARSLLVKCSTSRWVFQPFFRLRPLFRPLKHGRFSLARLKLRLDAICCFRW